MKNKFLLFFITFALFNNFFATAQTSDYEYSWGAVNVHTLDTDDTNAYSQNFEIAFDNENNIITVGEFRKRADFSYEGTHASVIDTAVLNNHNTRYGFIKKTDESGNYLWHKKYYTRFPINKSPKDLHLVIDNAGNIYIKDVFVDTLTIGGYDIIPPKNTYIPSNWHYCIIKMSKDGNLLWVKTYPQGAVGIMNFAVDTQQNIYLGGALQRNNVDLDPGTGEDIQSPPHSVSNSSISLMIIKLDEYGNYVWAKTQFGEAQSGCEIFDVEVKNSDLYLFAKVSRPDEFNSTHGNDVSGPTDLDPDETNEEIFQVGFTSTAVMKFDTDGNYDFAKVFTVMNDTIMRTIIPVDIKIGTDNSIALLFTSSSLIDTIDLDPGPDTVRFYYSDDYAERVILVKLDEQGNYINSFGVPGDFSAMDDLVEQPNLLITSNNDLIIGKTYKRQGTSTGPYEIDLDPGDGEFLVRGIYNNTCISAYDSNLNFKWAGQFDEQGGNWFGASAINKNNGNIAISTQIWQDHNVDLNIFDGEDYREEQNLSPVIAIYSPIPSAISEHDNVNIKIYPNPSNNIINIETNENYSLKVIDITGKIISAKNLQKGISNIKINQKGIYLLKFSNANNIVTESVIIK